MTTARAAFASLGAASSPHRGAAVPISPALTGAPRVILRLEGAAALAAAVAAYAQFGQGWMLFAVLFLIPDLSMLGYLAGPRVGAGVYNAGHSHLGPAALGAVGVVAGAPIAIAVALIWLAHIGFDRMLGYGLKYPTAFGHTHVGRVGRAKQAL